MPKATSQIDRRLIGTWRSDGRRTLKEYSFPEDSTDKDRRRIRRYFGDLILRYTARRIYSRLRDRKGITPYTVIAMDSESVAILYWDSLLEEHRIQHIHFEGDRFWISLGDRNREFFRRVHED